MSRNTTNTSLQTVALSDDARIATYYQMIANLINFFCDTKKNCSNSGLPDTTD